MKHLIYSFILVSLFSCNALQPETNNSISDTKKNDNNDYYKNGNIRIEKKRLENGDSLWIFKQEDGGCWEENFYREGEIYKKIVYNSDCTKSAEYELKDGKRNGEWKNYHENGKLREEGNYEMGLENGVFNYYDENEKLTRTEHYFIRDSFLVDFWSPSIQKNDYPQFIEHLNSQAEKFIVTEEIKVGGNKEYHFPVLKVGNSTLYFEHLENNDQVRCIRGELNDCTFMIFEKICPGNGDGGLLVLTGIQWTKGMEYVNIVDLSQKTVYHFKLEKDDIKSVSFEPIEFRN